MGYLKVLVLLISTFDRPLQLGRIKEVGWTKFWAIANSVGSNQGGSVHIG